MGGDRYKVELIVYDDKGETDTIAKLVERLIDEDDVGFLLGPYRSTLTNRPSRWPKRGESPWSSAAELPKRSSSGRIGISLPC